MKRGIITNNGQDIHLSDGEIWMTSWEISDLFYATVGVINSRIDVAELPKEETIPSSANNISIEESKQPSEYEVLRATAMAEKERASQEKLNKILTYTKRTLVTYLNEVDLNRLCGYITEYYLSDSLPKVEQIKVDTQLKTIDFVHFG